MKKFLLFMLVLTVSCYAHGQTNRVGGTVTDAEDGTPLPGVTVMVKGTSNGTTTDINGKYTLTASPDDSLSFSFVGYNTRIVPVGNQTTIDIAIAPSVQELSEVVVTALGIKREKRALGYSVSEIGNENIAGNGEPNAISSIAGKVAGVNISGTTAGPTGSSRVVIRGIRELNGDNQPLYVIDGVPVVNGNIESADGTSGGFDLGDGLSDINPNNIESISVLKGASAAALYGSRAMNGVILITTKKGTGKKGIGLEYNSSLTLDQINTRLDQVQTTYGQGNNGTLPTDAAGASNITSNWGPAFTDYDEIIQRDGTTRPYEYIDNNIQDFFRTGQTWMNSVAINGGGENANVRLAYSNVTSTDVIPNSNFDRNIIDIFARANIVEGLSVDAKVSYTVEDVLNRPALTDAVNNIGNGLIGLAGNFDQAWLQNYAFENGEYINYTGNAYRANPYWTLNRTRNESTKERVNGYVSLNYALNEMFSFSAQAGTDFYSFYHENFYDKYTPTFEGGVLRQLDRNVQESNFQGLINFRKGLSDDFRLSAMLGGNLMRQRAYGEDIQGSQIIQEGVSNVLNFSETLIQPFDDRKEIQSLFASAELSFREYIFLNLQGRNDWASTLWSPTGNDVSYFYPSADLSFVLTDAMDINSRALSFAKIRASLGQVGSDANPYQTTFNYTLSGRSMYGNPFGEILGDVIPNPNLRPQIKTSFELGTDVRLFDGRINLDLTYYNEVTEDAILQIPIPETSGYSRAALNAATLKNTGVEILLNTTPVSLANGFRWDLSLNYAKNYNTIVSLYEGIEAYPVAEARWAGVTIMAEEGRPFGTIYGTGFQRDDQGRIIHDANGLPLATDSPIVLGNSLPDWTGGIINSFSYKGFELKAALDIRMGGDIFSMTNMQMASSGAHAMTEAGRESFNEWQQERRYWQDRDKSQAEIDALVQQDGRGYIGDGVNENGEINNVPVNPATYWQQVANNIPEPFVYDASYVKLRDLGLTYTFSRAAFARLPFQAVSIGVIGRNLWIIHKNTPNIDPESNYNNGNGQGFEYGSLPGRRRFGFNVNVRF